MYVQFIIGVLCVLCIRDFATQLIVLVTTLRRPFKIVSLFILFTIYYILCMIRIHIFNTPQFFITIFADARLRFRLNVSDIQFQKLLPGASIYLNIQDFCFQMY
jgi:hypothetical protein